MASPEDKPASPPSKIPRKPVSRGGETRTQARQPSSNTPDTTTTGKPTALSPAPAPAPAPTPASAPAPTTVQDPAPATAPANNTTTTDPIPKPIPSEPAATGNPTTSTTAAATTTTANTDALAKLEGGDSTATTTTKEGKENKASESVTSGSSGTSKSKSKSNGKSKRNTFDFMAPADFQGEVQTDNTLPSPETLQKIESYTVQDADGRSHTFRSLYAGRNVARRVMIIFVRHFFCGNCQEYLRTLSASITPDALLQLPVSTFIAVVGCGSPELINPYIQETGCPFPVYTDPTRKLYAELGMMSTLRLGSRPAYMQGKSLMQVTASGVVQGLKQIRSGLATKSGDQRQVGGEFLFEPASLSLEPPIASPVDEGLSTSSAHRYSLGEDDAHDALTGAGATISASASAKSAKEYDYDHEHGGDDADDSKVEPKRITWCHRMRTTRDHAEIPELMEVLGLVEVEEGADGDGVMRTNAPRLKADEKRWDKALKSRKGTGSSMAARMSRMSLDVARSISGSLGAAAASGGDDSPTPSDNNHKNGGNSRNGSVAEQEAAPRVSTHSRR